MNSIKRRVARLEREHLRETCPEIVAVFDHVEAERVMAARGESTRPILCVVTGVPRPPKH